MFAAPEASKHVTTNIMRFAIHTRHQPGTIIIQIPPRKPTNQYPLTDTPDPPRALTPTLPFPLRPAIDASNPIPPVPTRLLPLRKAAPVDGLSALALTPNECVIREESVLADGAVIVDGAAANVRGSAGWSGGWCDDERRGGRLCWGLTWGWEIRSGCGRCWNSATCCNSGHRLVCERCYNLGTCWNPGSRRSSGRC